MPVLPGPGSHLRIEVTVDHVASVESTSRWCPAVPVRQTLFEGTTELGRPVRHVDVGAVLDGNLWWDRHGVHSLLMACPISDEARHQMVKANPVHGQMVGYHDQNGRGPAVALALK